MDAGFQFQKSGPLPGFEDVLPHLDDDLHPVAIHNFLTLPSVDLYAEDLDRELSPREWLMAGYPASVVARLAAALA